MFLQLLLPCFFVSISPMLLIFFFVSYVVAFVAVVDNFSEVADVSAIAVVVGFFSATFFPLDLTAKKKKEF